VGGLTFRSFVAEYRGEAAEVDTSARALWKSLVREEVLLDFNSRSSLSVSGLLSPLWWWFGTRIDVIGGCWSLESWMLSPRPNAIHSAFFFLVTPSRRKFCGSIFLRFVLARSCCCCCLCPSTVDGCGEPVFLSDNRPFANAVRATVHGRALLGFSLLSEISEGASVMDASSIDDASLKLLLS